MAKIKMMERFVYGLVGAAGSLGVFYAVSDWTTFQSTMPLLSQVAYWLLVVGGLNWGVIAFRNDTEKGLVSAIFKIFK